MLNLSWPPWALGRLNSGASAPTSGTGTVLVRVNICSSSCVKVAPTRILQVEKRFDPGSGLLPLLSYSGMKLLMTHGYMLSGTGSNVYVQNLCRALAREGHDVHLLCQEREALSYGFVAEHYVVDGEHIERRGVRETPYAGRCAVYNPEIGDLLPVYVYDEYPGWRVRTFLDLTDEELESYLARNVEAVRAVIEASSAEAVVTNHSVPGPLISRRALEGSGVPYVSIVHGSCLHYVSRKSEKYMRLTREGLEGARRILALSSDSAGTIAESFPDLADRTSALPGGVNTQLFRPDAFDTRYLKTLLGGPGRGPEQAAA